jgi:hypothetical protein
MSDPERTQNHEPPATVANGSELATLPLPRASSAQAAARTLLRRGRFRLIRRNYSLDSTGRK